MCKKKLYNTGLAFPENFVRTFNNVCIGYSMVSSAIWKKTCTSEFFKDDRNCTSPKDECNLTSLKNSRVYVFSNCTRNHTITC